MGRKGARPPTGAVSIVAGAGRFERIPAALVRSPPGMANIKSQIKRNKQNEKRRLRNKAARSEIKTRIKTAVAEVEAGAETGADALRVAVKRLDKAAAKGIIHKNQAANRKSALMRRLGRVTGPAE
jgi:small subunit ribosomal protein S20